MIGTTLIVNDDNKGRRAKNEKRLTLFLEGRRRQLLG